MPAPELTLRAGQGPVVTQEPNSDVLLLEDMAVAVRLPPLKAPVYVQVPEASAITVAIYTLP